MIMQESVLYIVFALLCVVIYLLIIQRKNKCEAKNSEEFDLLKNFEIGTEKLENSIVRRITNSDSSQ